MLRFSVWETFCRLVNIKIKGQYMSHFMGTLKSLWNPLPKYTGLSEEITALTNCHTKVGVKGLRTKAFIYPFKSLREFFQYAWNPYKEAIAFSKEAISLRQEIEKLGSEISQQNREHTELKNWNAQLSEILCTLTESMQARVWRKNAYHQYLFANHLHCKKFLGMDTSPDCLQHIVGKSDMLLNMLSPVKS